MVRDTIIQPSNQERAVKLYRHCFNPVRRKANITQSRANGEMFDELPISDEPAKVFYPAFNSIAIYRAWKAVQCSYFVCFSLHKLGDLNFATFN